MHCSANLDARNQLSDVITAPTPQIRTFGLKASDFFNVYTK